MTEDREKKEQKIRVYTEVNVVVDDDDFVILDLLGDHVEVVGLPVLLDLVVVVDVVDLNDAECLDDVDVDVVDVVVGVVVDVDVAVDLDPFVGEVVVVFAK